MNLRSLCYLLLLLFGTGACRSPQARLLLPAGSDVVKVEVDSFNRRPEIAYFSVRLTLTNSTSHHVVLAFDTIATTDSQVKNLYLVAGRDTFYLGLNGKDKHLVFSANTTTSFMCKGYFVYGKGHFDSYGQIDSVFRYGKLVYEFNHLLLPDVDFPQPSPAIDTVFFPTKMEAPTAQAVGVSCFSPSSYRWREKRLDPN